MGIFTRLTDIINANINSLLDKAEDPEKIVRLMIQEMEDTLVEVRSAAAKAIADRKERHRALTYLDQESIDWEHKAELALSKDREDLARAALVEKSRIGERIARLKDELAIIDKQLDKLNDDISKLQAKLNDARTRQRALSMRHKTAHSQLKVRQHIHDHRIDEVLNRFEHAERKIDQVESEAEAIDMGHNPSLAEEIANLERGDAIKEELDALKARMKQEPAADSGDKK